ncbi:putative diguanylate cyclase YcdT [Labrenzia sp. THAF82]|uniref:nitrate- and nitrite sensing domain-containing protein n=1 Tax=Labrenzia sp. THAF82 TaxID=2587861 RepID=UPI00126875C7|nr:nitrate- and nitrite sensing domain-containing protein [Labrenzia sp. THAF82]QFT34582.1 putative diguanylate cyclase YcdT [Labrenzia sp. THAF82]
MSSFLANRSIAFKLALVCWVPVLALIAISAQKIHVEYQAWQRAEAIGEVLNVAPILSDLVHDIQRERGTSAGLVGSRGLAFKQSIKDERSETDADLKRLQATVGTPSGKLAASNFTDPYNGALADLKNLTKIRQEVDALQITVPDIANYYTGIVAQLLEAIEKMKLSVDNAEVLHQISAYIALQHAKEHAGLERAMGAVGFGSGSFEPETYQRFLSLVAQQDNMFSQFRQNAPTEALVLLSKLQHGPLETRVQEYREIAQQSPYGTSTALVSGKDWWDATTARIDALKSIEDRLSRSLHDWALEACQKAWTSFLTLTAFLVALVAGAALVSLLVYREIQPPIARINSSMASWASDGAIPDLKEAQRRDGIGELARTLNDLRHRLEDTRKIELERNARERAQTQEMKLLSDLNEWLQSSTSTDELYAMIETFMAKLLPESSGSVYVFSNSRDVLDGTCAWNGGELHEHIRPDDCWSLRRGRGYSFKTDDIKFACEHTQPHDDGPYYCIPILAHGETVGMMHLKPLPDISTDAFFESYRLAQLAAEQISLAIANSKMRDQLHQQSIRDPLTGLFNRRHFIEVLRRNVETSKRTKAPFVLASIDVDHFKRFNDNHGHDAGDMVLRAVGSTLEQACGVEELPCRIGGEEFMLLLSDTTLEAAENRAEEIRQLIEKITVRYGEKSLPKITISVGLSAYPEHGSLPQDLMQSADDALYKSKAAGRNQVTIANLAKEVPDQPTVDFDRVKEELIDHVDQRVAKI